MKEQEQSFSRCSGQDEEGAHLNPLSAGSWSRCGGGEVQQEEDTLMQGNAITRHQPRPATASPGQQLCPGRGQSLAGALGRSPPVIA